MKQRIKQRKGLFNWFTILLVIIIGYFAVILVKQQIYLNQVSADQAAAEERLATARAEHERLVKEKDDLNRLDYIEKIAREAPYHELTNGGHISYIELDGDPTQNLEAFEAVVRAMKEAGIGYGAINHPIDRDPVCGYTGIIGEVCPRCGRREGEGVPLSKLQKLGLYKNYNSTTIGYHGDPAEEADRQPNTLKIVKK